LKDSISGVRPFFLKLESNYLLEKRILEFIKKSQSILGLGISIFNAKKA